MFRYHHLGIPTSIVRPDERYLPEFGMHVSGYESSPSPGVLVAFVVDNGAPVELMQLDP